MVVGGGVNFQDSRDRGTGSRKHWTAFFQTGQNGYCSFRAWETPWLGESRFLHPLNLLNREFKNLSWAVEHLQFKRPSFTLSHLFIPGPCILTHVNPEQAQHPQHHNPRAKSRKHQWCGDPWQPFMEKGENLPLLNQ